jgi:glycosyltransferase involved in cell wall biosynthesis
MREFEVRGYEVTLVPIEKSATLEAFDSLGRFDVVVLWKYAGTLGMHEQIVAATRRLGIALVYDVCDDYSENELFGPEFLTTIRDAPIVVAASRALADMILEKTGRTATVISEPFEGPRGSARWEPAGDRLKLLWFGHWANRSTLDAMIPDLLAFGARRPLSLSIVTKAESDLGKAFKQFNQSHRHRLSMRYIEWSPEALWRALADADAVVIPQQISDKVRNAKSPNRLVESMWAGRFVVASPIPAYREFGAWAALHERMSDGLEWALAHGDELRGRIAEAQKYIESRYSPSAIGDLWEGVLKPLE